MPLKEHNMIYGVTLDKDVAHQAKVIAAKLRNSRSGLMRDLLLQFIAAQQSVHPTGGRRGEKWTVGFTPCG
jgi:predicted transcriptional regulator